MDPSVNAVVHFVRSQYFKHMKDFAEFYKSSLLYLAYISSEALPQEQKLVSNGTLALHTADIATGCLRGTMTTASCLSCSG